MKVTIEIPGIPKDKEEHWNGILLSFFATMEEILKKKRKSSYLIHFFRERLKRNEQREFLRILSKIILALAKKQENLITGSSVLEENQRIPPKLNSILRSFQGVSIPTTESRQRHNKARRTPIKAEVLSNLVKEAIVQNVKSNKD